MSDGSRATEREVKLGLEDTFSLEAIDGLVVWSSDDRSLDATYFDTADLRLLSLGHTLRHRTGEGVEGGVGGVGTWTLKLAGVAGEVDGRDEITVDGPAGAPPRSLLLLVAGVLGEQPVVEVAHLLTERRRSFAVYERTDVEVAVDVVTGTPALGPAEPVSFRQLEIELVEGDERMLPRLAAAACRAGAVEASQEAKVATVLGSRVGVAHLAPVQLRGRSTIDELVRGAITAGLRQLLTHDPHLRLDAPDDSVHKARVATRRLRSDLQTLRPLLHGKDVDRMAGELRWLAAQIGAVRDLDVLAEHVTEWTAEWTAEWTGEWTGAMGDEGAAVAPVTPVLLARLRNQRRVAALVMRNALRSQRYRAMVDELRAWSVAPPWGRHAHPGRRARRDAVDLVRHADGRVRHAVDRLDDPPATVDLHELRKRAKRCRYAAELVSPLVDDDLDDLAGEMAGLQDVLGGLQDAATAQRWLDSFPLERLDEAQLAAVDRLFDRAGDAALDARIHWPERWADAKRACLRPWE